MGLLLTISTLYIPPFIRKQKLEMLFKATSDAFQATVPSTGELSFNDCLKLYAHFTREQADKAIQQGNQLVVQTRLYQNAFRIGQQIRTDFNIHTAEEVMRMSTLIYKILKIDFQGESGGKIVIRRCFFSAYYSNEVCRLISCLDEGLLVGLAGGGKLRFYRRITEGDKCCRACLETARRLE